MFEHLVNDKNKIVFTETVLDRDGAEVCVFVIGVGYGIFGGLSTTEMALSQNTDYKSACVCVHYSTVHTPDITVGEEVYKQTATEPELPKARLRYQCSWQGKVYSISGVSKKCDIHGNFVGYRIYSENE